jgi:FXSXX-COOH protein
MSDESNIARDVLIDVSGLSLADLPGNGDSSLLRALRRYLAPDDEADVIAEWNQGF